MINLDWLWVRVRHELVNFNGYHSPRFPAYNVVAVEDGRRIEMALAGWDKDNVRVTQDKNTLTIEGTLNQDLDWKGERYIYKGANGRTFKQKWALGQNVNVSADLKDGMLTLHLKVNQQESKKTRLINIS